MNADRYADSVTSVARVPARKVLCMAALCTTPPLKVFNQKSRAKEKPAKVALTAAMRKLLLHLNSTFKTPLQTAA